jgi:hypothetical protein
MFKRSHATTFILPLVLLLFGASAAAQTLPLVRFQGKSGAGVYAAAPAHRKVYESNPSMWDAFGTVGYCQATKQPGAMPLLNLMRPTKFGGEHFYTTDVNEAINVQNSSAVWVADELSKVVCFVATSKLPGTVAVYRYRQPDGKSYIYAFGEAEHNQLKQKADLKFERVAFYVWAQAAGEVKSSPFPDLPPQKPDLSVGNVGVMSERKVIFAVRNNGFAINKREFNARLTAYQGNERVVWTSDKTIAPVIAQGASSEHSIEAPEGKSLVGVRVRVTVDSGGVIEETDESNNTSGFVDGIPISIPGSVIIGTRPTPTGGRPAPVPQERRQPAPAPQEGQQTTPDLRLRAALYANGAETGKVNTAARYASPNRPLRLNKSDAVSCEGDVCGFNLGFFAQRNAATGDLSTYALLAGPTFGSVGNTVFFATGEMSKGVVHLVRLKLGENKITVELDPQKRLAESDESNNSFEVTIFVEP